MRQPKPSGGRAFSKTCRVRGREPDERMAILKTGRDNTRIARIGADGLTLDGSVKVPTANIHDVLPANAPNEEPRAPVHALVGERGTITIPSEIRRRHRLLPGSPILIEDHSDSIVIVPAEIVPRRAAPDRELDRILANVTSDNVRAEVPAGDAVGGESR
jgi:AbrB family looped-hinge helix DNA binding protein